MNTHNRVHRDWSNPCCVYDGVAVFRRMWGKPANLLWATSHDGVGLVATTPRQFKGISGIAQLIFALSY